MNTYDEDDMREAREDQRAVVKEFEKRLAAKDAEIEALKDSIKKIRPHLHLFMFGEKYQDMMKAYLSELDAALKGKTE